MHKINYNNFYQYLVNRLENICNFDSNKAIIFDIDGTIINAKEYEWIDHIIVDPVYFFYRYCMQKNLNIFIITARSGNKENIDFTNDKISNKLNLKFNKMFFRNPLEEDVPKFKQTCRNIIK